MRPTFTLRGRDATCDTCGAHLDGGGKDWRVRSAHLCTGGQRA